MNGRFVKGIHRIDRSRFTVIKFCSLLTIKAKLSSASPAFRLYFYGIPFIRKILRILVFWIERRKNIYSKVITKDLRLSNWCRENNILF